MKRAAARDRASPAARSHHAARLAESPSAVVFAAYQQALADRSTAQLNLDRTVVHAAGNGFVANLTLDVAQYASVGTKVMALIDSDSYRVTGYFEETKSLSSNRVATSISIRLAVVNPCAAMSRASAAASLIATIPLAPSCSPMPIRPLSWGRLAQRIPMRIHIDDIPTGVLISSGMTCTVVVESPTRQWAVLAALRGWKREALR
jgi:multidrug resistance efflux pump